MIRVRRFEEKDAQALAGLMTEITRFSGATVRPDLVVAEDVVQQARQVNVIVALDDARLLGFASQHVAKPKQTRGDLPQLGLIDDETVPSRESAKYKKHG